MDLFGIMIGLGIMGLMGFLLLEDDDSDDWWEE